MTRTITKRFKVFSSKSHISFFFAEVRQFNLFHFTTTLSANCCVLLRIPYYYYYSYNAFVFSRTPQPWPKPITSRHRRWNENSSRIKEKSLPIRFQTIMRALFFPSSRCWNWFPLDLDVTTADGWSRAKNSFARSTDWEKMPEEKSMWPLQGRGADKINRTRSLCDQQRVFVWFSRRLVFCSWARLGRSELFLSFRSR